MVKSHCYDVEIHHRRTHPIDYRFSYRTRIWLVDLDELPALPRAFGWLCRFDSADHLGPPDRPLRSSIDDWLRRRDIPVPDRILMLGNPRVLGYVFNPLTVFYCLDSGGEMSHVVAEVHNTYGGRHGYLVQPATDGTAEVAKAFLVSPFHPADGLYRMRVPLPGEQVLVDIRLQLPRQQDFVAVMTGARSGSPERLWAALRAPLATRAVLFAIRRHGILLYLKGLRPVRFNRGSEVA